jgi:acyl-CoA thioesterase-2
MAYSSDLTKSETVIPPGGVDWISLVEGHGVFGASLDHSLRFHRPLRADRRLLHIQECHASYASRGLSPGSFYSLSEDLVASVAQEFLTRADPPAVNHIDAVEIGRLV